MRIIRALVFMSMGVLVFLTACGAAADDSPPATIPAANASGGMDMTPAPAQTTTAANFTTSDLTVNPDKPMVGDRVMVGVTVTNTGTQQGTYTVVVKDHDGTLLGKQDVTLAGGAKETVSLHISVNTTGTHMVMIDKLWHNLVVQAASATNPPPPPPPPATPGNGPAAFVLSNLVVPSGMIMPEDKLTVSVYLVNTGGAQGTYKVTMSIHDNQTNKDTEKTQDVMLAGGAEKNVVFPITAGPDGSYVVTIGDLTSVFTVAGH